MTEGLCSSSAGLKMLKLSRKSLAVLNRITCEDVGLTEEFCVRHPLEGLTRYMRFVTQTKNRYAIKKRRYRFDGLNRLYCEGEPGFKVNERDELRRRYVQIEKLQRSMPLE